MAAHQIRAISLSEASNALASLLIESLERITHIHGDFGTRTTAEAVEDIRTFRASYFVRVGLEHSDVHVVAPPGRTPHLQTAPDHTKKDNLLSLPRR